MDLRPWGFVGVPWSFVGLIPDEIPAIGRIILAVSGKVVQHMLWAPDEWLWYILGNRAPVSHLFTVS